MGTQSASREDLSFNVSLDIQSFIPEGEYEASFIGAEKQRMWGGHQSVLMVPHHNARGVFQRNSLSRMQCTQTNREFLKILPVLGGGGWPETHAP